MSLLEEKEFAQLCFLRSYFDYENFPATIVLTVITCIFVKKYQI